MNPKYALLVAAAVLLAGCAGVATTEPTDANAASGAVAANATAHTVTAGGTGDVSADPDVAYVNVAVEARAETAGAARDAVAADAESLRTALADAGLTVNTTGYYLSPEYNHSRDGSSSEVVAYRAVQTFEVEAPVDRAGEAVDLAVDGGAARVDGVRFGLSDERRADLREEAVAAAVTDARTDAAAAAAAADRQVGDVVSVRVGSDGGSTPYTARETADAGAGTSFQPGPVTVTATVTVTYELTE